MAMAYIGAAILLQCGELFVSSLSTRSAEARFRRMATRGKPKRGLAILDRLDAIDARKAKRHKPVKKRPSS